MPRKRTPPSIATLARRAEIVRREGEVSNALRRISQDGQPVTLESIVGACNLPRPLVVSTLHDLAEHVGSGPLFIDGGYVWVQIGPEAQAAD